jgi:predicted ATPase
MPMTAPPYLQRICLRPDAALDASRFPTSLPVVRGLDLELDSAATFFVGENGSGKSTLLEAIAELCGLPAGGGGRNELAEDRPPHARGELAPLLRAGFRRKPRDGYFFRAELQAHFASLLEARRADPDFLGNPYARYGGRSLHTRSHGEAFLAMMTAWMAPGIILMDEPEAALSPQRQLALLARMAQLVRGGEVQLIIATHSAILLTLPGASLLSFDGPSIRRTRLEDTSHYQITRGILEQPGRYWQHLGGET